ncbi:hypothetical protein [Clostridium tagluense]|uniref:Uncharacterized protein n=1 Tax=Clostridium tagluense TaxID=360422 RepID=A0A401UU67_9CLOT|nr:hypothetical protein [Clostridium tagluense]GCD13044.1 hypothetical protein Ctaglu_46670 [Clostridium tagluense]
MNRPEPSLIEAKDGWIVTDGWIRDAHFRVLKQPSEKALKYLDEFFLDNYIESKKQGNENTKGGQVIE